MAALEDVTRQKRAANASRASSLWGTDMTTLQDSAQKQLRQLIEQIERLEEEKKALAADVRDKYLEAKSLGFDVKIMRKVVSLRKKSKTERQEEESVLAVYLHALGMLDDMSGIQLPPEMEARVMDAAE